MGQKFLTAAEARQVSDATSKLSNLVHRLIRNRAEDGYENLMFDCTDISNVAKKKLVNLLKEEGYKICLEIECYDQNAIEIAW